MRPPGWLAGSVAQLMAGLITFYSFSILDRLRNPVLLFDGAGLALFACGFPAHKRRSLSVSIR